VKVKDWKSSKKSMKKLQQKNQKIEKNSYIDLYPKIGIIMSQLKEVI